MAFRLRFPALFEGLLNTAQLRLMSHWGLCIHCAETTPWYANGAHDEYRCTACGKSPLGERAPGV